MPDDEDIRELIGRMTGAQRQGFHVTPSALRLVLAALRFYLAARGWAAGKARDPHDDAPSKKPERYTGPPATIGSLRGSGLIACTVQCDGPNCWHAKRITFDELRLPDATPFPDIPKRQVFRCQRCGCRRVRVSPDWTDHKAQGNGREPSERDAR